MDNSPEHIDLSPFQLLRPERITWILPKSTDVFSQIRSKGLRGFLSKADQLLEQNNISYSIEENLSRDQYLKWLEYYTAKMTENQYDILAKPDWYDQRLAEGKTIGGYFFYQDQQLVGSAIVTQLQDINTLAFKASDRIELSSRGNSNLGSAIEYIFLRETLKSGRTASSGSSRNAFGVINNLGHLDFKLRFGYRPHANLRHPIHDKVPIQNGVVVFCASKSGVDELKFFILHDKEVDVSKQNEVLKLSPIEVEHLTF